MRSIPVLILLGILGATAWGRIAAAADDTEAAEAAKAEAEAEEREFKPPPGYRAKRFGDKTFYCIKDTEIGSRFKSEKCYDEAQLAELIRAQQENKANIDRTRSICSNPGICAPQ